MNKLVPTLVLSVTVAVFIIGIHQMMTVGAMASYWIFMLCVALLFLYKLIKPKNDSSK